MNEVEQKNHELRKQEIDNALKFTCLDFARSHSENIDELIANAKKIEEYVTQ